ncbi:sensor histidine kinase [Proteiniborus sp.]|uniref:sensor histidine kinase n=1 Tax=Proteiniborus sp. TaxID=2079015 RepID=UPI003330DAB9
MNKLIKYNSFLNVGIRTLILVDIIYRCRNNTTRLLIFTAWFLLILANDHLRINKFYIDYRKYYISIFVSMLLSLVLIFNLNGYVYIYMFMVLYELILFNQGKIANLLTILEIIFIVFIVVFRSLSSVEEIVSIKYWKENILDIFMFLQFIFFYSISLLSYKALRKEKKEVEKLNDKLEESYNKLKEQSKKIEELVITEERNRIAGDIHDNLGHTLIALNMNLDVAANIIDKDTDKAKELLYKAQILTKDSLKDLRKAVYALKEENPEKLLDSLERIVNNMESIGNIKVILNYNENVNELLTRFKNIICPSIKEALTNSVKHGKADRVYIDIKIENNNAYIKIRDNGLGCGRLTKGNGLLGIENRIIGIGGKVIYNSEEGKGFEIDIYLSL